MEQYPIYFVLFLEAIRQTIEEGCTMNLHAVQKYKLDWYFYHQEGEMILKTFSDRHHSTTAAHLYTHGKLETKFLFYCFNILLQTNAGLFMILHVNTPFTTCDFDIEELSTSNPHKAGFS